MHRKLTLAAVLLLALALPAQAQEAKWLKGNLHTHSFWSDGDDFPEMISLWYRDRGYQFLALSDHNILSIGEKWMPVRTIRTRGGDLAIDKYKKQFPDVFKSRHTTENGEEILLQPLAKVKELTERPGEFLMIQSEEITDKLDKLPVHMCATNVQEVIKPLGGASVREIIQNNLRQVMEQSKRLNKPMVAHLNHPNFGWGVAAVELAAVVEEQFFEVYNGHPGVHQRGDATHPSVEKIWDICNTIRLAQLNARPLMGLATDDSHHYHVPGMSRSGPGRGWVMVKSQSLDADAITSAIIAGDFYASSGVTLKSVEFNPASKVLKIEIEPDSDATYATHFVGTPKNFADGGKTPLDSELVGQVFKVEQGLSASYRMTGEELYVRAIVNSSKAPANPSFENQKQQAWTQPVGWRQ